MKYVRCLILFLFINPLTRLEAGVINDSVRFAVRDTIKDAVVRRLCFDSRYFVPYIAKYDSSENDIQRYLPYYRHTLYPMNLGIIGSAAVSHSFFDMPSGGDYIFLKPFAFHFFDYKNAEFYNTRRPYSRMKFSGSANQLEAFNAIITQNMTKEWNIGAELDFNGAKGAIKNQKTGTHELRAFSTYYGSRYSFVGQYSVNRLFAQENGGVQDSTDMRMSGLLAEMGNVNLPNAQSVTRFRQIYLRQEFNLTGRYKKPDSIKVEFWEFPLSLGHEFKADRAYRRFQETLEGIDASRKYYGKLGIDTLATLDTVLQSNITNSLFLKKNYSGLFNGGILAGLGVETERNQTNRSKQTDYNNGFVYGSLNIKAGLRMLDVNAKMYLTGRKEQNMEIDGVLINEFPKFDSTQLKIHVVSSLESPAYYYETYSTNHFGWNNTDLKKQKNLKGEIVFGASDNSYCIKATSALLVDYIYLYQDMKLYQSSKQILVNAFDARKTTLWGPLYLSNSVLFQSTSAVIHLPHFSTVNTIALQGHLFKKVMRLKVGFDVLYWTSYFTPGYMPELGMFYKQTKTKHGNYPYVDAFMQADVKRLQFFAKYSHISYYANVSDDFYAVDRYPVEKPAFSFGLSWYFYN